MKEGAGDELLNTCSLCLSSNRRTINIRHTYLQSIYEKLIKYKIEHDAYLCFICHRRLQQCHQFVTLAKETQISRENYKQNGNMIDIKPPPPLVELSTCEVMNFGVPCFDSVQTGEPRVKEEPESDEDIEENCEDDDDESQENFDLQNSESEDSLPKKVTERRSPSRKSMKNVKQNKRTKN